MSIVTSTKKKSHTLFPINIYNTWYDCDVCTVSFVDSSRPWPLAGRLPLIAALSRLVDALKRSTPQLVGHNLDEPLKSSLE